MALSSQDNPGQFAVIIGLDSLQGLQAARVLSSRKVPVIGIAKDLKHYGCRTKVCKEILFTNTYTEELIKSLKNLGSKLRQKMVLFPCEDLIVSLVSKHRDELKEWYYIALPAPDIVELLMDKISFYRHAQKEGLAIPKTFFLSDKADVEEAISKLTFPCILKPPIKSQEWTKHTKIKAFKVFNPEELLSIYDQYYKWTDSLIVQEYIEGDDTDHYTCHCYFDASSNPVVTFTSRKIRQWPPHTGQRSVGEECQNNIVAQETIRLFQSVNFYGLAYLEMKRDSRSGKHYIIEPNIGRPTGTSTMAEAGGVEMLYTMYCDVLGWPLPANLEQKYKGVKWVYLRQDLQAFLLYRRNGELTFKEWWHSIQGRKTYAVFSWSDPAPFFADMIRLVKLLLNPKERRKRQYQQTIS